MSTEAIAAAVPSAGATPPAKTGQNNASVLYNAMVAPWNKFSVRSAFWYQGEANADQKIKGNDQTQYYAAM
jgi:sialate O-acetylesterase